MILSTNRLVVEIDSVFFAQTARCSVESIVHRREVQDGAKRMYHLIGSVTVTTEVGRNGATTLSRLSFSGCVWPATIFS